MIFALIKNGVVQNVIVADQTFIDNKVSGYDHKIRIDNLDPIPGIEWEYDGSVFTNPNAVVPPPEE